MKINFTAWDEATKDLYAADKAVLMAIMVAMQDIPHFKDDSVEWVFKQFADSKEDLWEIVNYLNSKGFLIRNDGGWACLITKRVVEDDSIKELKISNMPSTEEFVIAAERYYSLLKNEDVMPDTRTQVDKANVARTTVQFKQKAARQEKDIDYRAVLDGWNKLAENHGLSKIQKLSDHRKRSVAERVKEHGYPAIAAALAQVPNQDFLLGANDRGWKLDFNCFIKKKVFEKILEGAYGDDGGDGAYPDAGGGNGLGLTPYGEDHQREAAIKKMGDPMDKPFEPLLPPHGKDWFDGD